MSNKNSLFDGSQNTFGPCLWLRWFGGDSAIFLVQIVNDVVVVVESVVVHVVILQEAWSVKGARKGGKFSSLINQPRRQVNFASYLTQCLYNWVFLAAAPPFATLLSFEIL